MKPIVMLWAAAIAIVGSCLFWRNRRRYRRRALLWVAMKSAVELLILFLVAALMPALLIVWLVVWVTRPIKTPWVRTVVGVLSGVVFGIFSSFALEALIFFGVFAIDLKTGAHDGGFLHCWKRAREEDADRHPAVLVPQAKAA